MQFKIKTISEPTVNAISLIMVVSFFLAVVFNYVMSTAFHQSYPYSTFLFLPLDQFGDFVNLYKICKDFNPYDADYFFSSNYFPSGNAVFFLFSLISSIRVSLILFLTIFVIAYVTLAYYVNKKYKLELSPVTWFILFFMNYPLLFALDRANLELYLFIFISIFIIAYINKRYFIAAVFLALAVSMKLYPAVFFILFIRDKKWKEFAVFIVTGLFVTALSLAFHKGGLVHNFQLMLKQMIGVGGSYGSLSSYHFNDSLANLFIIPAALFLNSIGHSTKSLFRFADRIHFFNLYSIIVLVFFVCLCIYIWKNRTNIRYSILVLTVSMILFPVISYDYKLIYMLIPLLLFIRSDEIAVPFLISLLMIPKPYYFITSDVSIGVIVNSGLLFALFAIGFVRIVRKSKKTQS